MVADKMEEKIKGYKCFNKGLVNRYGVKFEIGKTYHAVGQIKYGNDGKGFHMCKNLEDTLRFFDAINGEIDICKVTGFGKLHKNDDNYNDFYDMYACEYLTIDELLTREEIIEYGLKLNEISVKRFISLIHLTDEEIALFKEKYQKNETVLNYIAYYQEGDKEVFNRKIRR